MVWDLGFRVYGGLGLSLVGCKAICFFASLADTPRLREARRCLQHSEKVRGRVTVGLRLCGLRACSVLTPAIQTSAGIGKFDMTVPLRLHVLVPN